MTWNYSLSRVITGVLYGLFWWFFLDKKISLDCYKIFIKWRNANSLFLDTRRTRSQ